MRICFHLEPYDGRTAAKSRQDLEYIVNEFGKSQAFYRSKLHENRPVYYVYDSYKMAASEWRKLFDKNVTLF